MMKTTYWQKYATITASVPTELKVDLIERAKILGISLNELMNKILFEEDCRVFDEQVSQLKAENEALQSQILELETKLSKQEEDMPEQTEEEADETAEHLQDFAQRLNSAYCELKNFAYKSFAEKEIYKEADRLLPDYLREDIIPKLQEMKAKGIENVANWFFSQMKNAEKIDKNKFTLDIEKAFDEACQMEKILNLKLTPEDKKDFFQSIKSEVKQDFEEKIQDIEAYIFSSKDYDLLASCELEENPEVEELEKDFEDDLMQEIQLNEYAQKTFEQENQKTALEETKVLPEPKAQEQLGTKNTYQPKDKNEAILHELYQKKTEFITKYELKALGFDTGFFSNLTVRGGKFGLYTLEKSPSEKVYKLKKNDEKPNK